MEWYKLGEQKFELDPEKQYLIKRTKTSDLEIAKIADLELATDLTNVPIYLDDEDYETDEVSLQVGNVYIEMQPFRDYDDINFNVITECYICQIPEFEL